MPLTRRSFVQTVSLLFGAESFSPRALEPHEQIEMQVAFGLREGRRHV